MMSMIRRLFAAGAILCALVGPVRSQDHAPGAEPAREAVKEPPRLPPDQTTHHVLELPGRTLKFTALAGAIRLSNDENVAQTDVAFIAYQLEGADRLTRPVTFVLNGGPGMASGWLQT